MKVKKHGIFSSLLSILLIFTMVLPSFAVEDKYKFEDIPNNWAKESIERAIDNKILKGYKGRIRPDDSLTRAELASIISRLLNLKEKGDLSSFTDLKKTWYYEDLSKVVEAGILKGFNNKIRPNEAIKREEVFVVMSRVLYIKSGNDYIGDFKDSDQVSTWSRDSINGLLKYNYIQGDDRKKLNPKKDITRAEFAKLLDNIVGLYLDSHNVSNINKEIKGNIIVRNPIEEIENMVIDGDLILGEGLLGSRLVLNNVEVKGRVLVRGLSDLELVGNTKINSLNLLDKTSLLGVSLEESSNIVDLESFRKLNLDGKGKIKNINLKKGSDESKLNLDSGKIKIDKNVNGIEISGKKVSDDQFIDLDELKLRKELEGLKLKVGKLDRKKYTRESIEALDQAMKLKETNQEEVNKKIEEVEKALKDLKLDNNEPVNPKPDTGKLDKEELEALKLKVDKLNRKKYTRESIEALDQAIKLDENSLEEVSKKIKAVEKALRDLKLDSNEPVNPKPDTGKLDKEKLEALKLKVGKLDRKKYTRKSIEALDQAMKLDETSQEEVNKKIKEVEKSLRNLEGVFSIKDYNPNLLVTMRMEDCTLNSYYYQVKLESSLKGDYKYRLVLGEKASLKKEISNKFPVDISWGADMSDEKLTLEIYDSEDKLIDSIKLALDFSNVPLELAAVYPFEDAYVEKGEKLELPDHTIGQFNDYNTKKVMIDWEDLEEDLDAGEHIIKGSLRDYEGYELELKVIVVDKAQLVDLKVKAGKVERDKYTEESIKVLDKALELEETSLEKVVTKIKALEKALEGLDLEGLVLDIKDDKVTINADVANIIIEGKTTGDRASLKLKNISIDEDLESLTLDLLDGQFKKVIGMDNNPSGKYLVKIKAFKGVEEVYKEFEFDFKNLFAIKKLKDAKDIEDFEDILFGDEAEGLVDTGLADLDLSEFDELKFELQDQVLAYIYDRLESIENSRDLQNLIDEGIENVGSNEEIPSIKEDLVRDVDFFIEDNYKGQDDFISFSKGVVFEEGLKAVLVDGEGKEIKLQDSSQVQEGEFTILKSSLGDLDKGSYEFTLKVSNDVGKAETKISFELLKGSKKEEAMKLLEKAEETETREDYELVEDFIKTLAEADREELSQRVEALENIIKAKEVKEEVLKSLDEAVKKLESNKTRENLDLVKKAIDQLEDSKEKNNYKARIERVEKYISARESEEIVLDIGSVFGHTKGAMARVGFKFKDSGIRVDKLDLSKLKLESTSHKIDPISSLSDGVEIIIHGDFGDDFRGRAEKVKETFKVNIYFKDSPSEDDEKISQAISSLEELEANFDKDKYKELETLLTTIEDSSAKLGLLERYKDLTSLMPKENEIYEFKVNNKFIDMARGSVIRKDGKSMDKDLELDFLVTSHRKVIVNKKNFYEINISKNKLDGKELSLRDEEVFHVHLVEKGNESEFDELVRKSIEALDVLEKNKSLEKYEEARALIYSVPDSDAKKGLRYRLGFLEIKGSVEEPGIEDSKDIEILEMEAFSQMSNMSSLTIEINKVARSKKAKKLSFVGPVESMDESIVSVTSYNGGVDVQGRVALKPQSPGETTVKVRVEDEIGNSSLVEIPIKITKGWPRLENGKNGGLVEGKDYIVEYDYSGEKVTPLAIKVNKDIFPREDLEVRLYKWDDKNNDGKCFPEKDELLKDSPIILKNRTKKDKDGNIVLDLTELATRELELDKGYKYMLAAYDEEVFDKDKRLSNVSPDFEIKFDLKSLESKIKLINILIESYDKNPTDEYYDGIVTRISILPDSEDKEKLLKKAKALKNIEIPNTVKVSKGVFQDYPGEFKHSQLVMIHLKTDDGSDLKDYNFDLSKIKVKAGSSEFYLGKKFEELDLTKYETYKVERDKLTIKASEDAINKLKDLKDGKFILEEGWCTNKTGVSADPTEIKIDFWR